MLPTTFYNYNWKRPITKVIDSKTLIFNPITRKYVPRLRPDDSKTLTKWKDLGSPLFKVFLPYQIKPNNIIKKLKALQLLENMGVPVAPFNIVDINKIKETDIFFILYTIYKYGYKKDKKGFVQIYSGTLKSYIGDHYNVALQFLFDYKYIQTSTASLTNGYHNGSKLREKNYSRKFRINPIYFINIENKKLLDHSHYDDVLLNIELRKKALINQKLKHIKCTHKNLAIMADAIIIDEKAFLTYIENNPEEVKGKDIDLTRLNIDRITNGITCKMDYDFFGERFYTDLSNLLSTARKFTHAGDYKYYKAIDVKNSQFYFLSQLFNSSIIDEFLIKREPNKNWKKWFRGFKNNLKQLKNNPDIITMLSRIKSGELYDHLAAELNISRKTAKKDFFFKSAFSKKNENAHVKKEIKRFYPSFYTLIEKTNSEITPKLLPMILQKVESRILLDEIAVELFTELNKLETKHPFFTVHDAFYVHPDVYDLSIDIIEKSFLKLGLEIPKLGD